MIEHHTPKARHLLVGGDPGRHVAHLVSFLHVECFAHLARHTLADPELRFTGDAPLPAIGGPTDLLLVPHAKDQVIEPHDHGEPTGNSVETISRGASRALRAFAFEVLVLLETLLEQSFDSLQRLRPG